MQQVPLARVPLILLAVVELVYSMCIPVLVAVDTQGMPLVAPASLEHIHSCRTVLLEMLVDQPDIRLDNVAVPRIHFGNWVLVELEVDFPDSLNALVNFGLLMYADFGIDQS